jgi:hypothetical protein
MQPTVAQRKPLQATNCWPRVARQSLNLKRPITQSSRRVDAFVTVPEREQPQPVTCNGLKNRGSTQLRNN